jgi:hypothetical protein
LAEALDRCGSGDESAAYVLLSEKEASEATSNGKEDVSRALDDLDNAAAADHS